MTSVLHIIRTPGDRRAFMVAGQHSLEHDVKVLLLQDAVAEAVDWPGQVYVGRDDCAKRSLESNYLTVDYERIVELIFAHERVIVW